MMVPKIDQNHNLIIGEQADLRSRVGEIDGGIGEDGGGFQISSVGLLLGGKASKTDVLIPEIDIGTIINGAFFFLCEINAGKHKPYISFATIFRDDT